MPIPPQKKAQAKHQAVKRRKPQKTTQVKQKRSKTTTNKSVSAKKKVKVDTKTQKTKSARKKNEGRGGGAPSNDRKPILSKMKKAVSLMKKRKKIKPLFSIQPLARLEPSEFEVPAPWIKRVRCGAPPPKYR